MRSRVIWRRSATAIGMYVAAVLGFLTTVVATRELGVHDYAKFAAVIAASTFFQQLLDLTIEEALVKFGFRYVEAERWGRLRRLFRGRARLQARRRRPRRGSRSSSLAPFSQDDLGDGRRRACRWLIASLISVAQSPENVAAGAIILRGRYDVRGGFLAVSMGLRLIGLAIGCRYGVVGARDRDGRRAGGRDGRDRRGRDRRRSAGSRAAPAEPLGDDVPRRSRSFLVSSTLASSLDSARGTLGTSLVADGRADRPGRLLPERPGARRPASRRSPGPRGS